MSKLRSEGEFMNISLEERKFYITFLLNAVADCEEIFSKLRDLIA